MSIEKKQKAYWMALFASQSMPTRTDCEGRKSVVTDLRTGDFYANMTLTLCRGYEIEGLGMSNFIIM